MVKPLSVCNGGCEVDVDADVLPNPPKSPPPLVVCGWDVDALRDSIIESTPPGVIILSEGLFEFVRLEKRSPIVIDDRAKGGGGMCRCCTQLLYEGVVGWTRYSTEFISRTR